jgi:hypothetical protein
MASMLFRNFGGILQYVVQTEADLAQIQRLAPALWAATSAPTRDFHCDPAVLGWIDTEKAGRIRVAQIIAARDWLYARLEKRDRVTAKSEVLSLADLASTEDAANLRKAAELVCEKLGLEDRSALSLGDLRTFRGKCAKLLENGDGVVPPEVVTEAETAAFICDVIAVVGGAPDASGLAGVGDAQIDRFAEGARAYTAWKAAGTGNEIQIFGDRTASLANLVSELDPKVAEYFLQCAILVQTQRTADALRLPDEDVRKLSAQPSSELESHLAHAPLAPPSVAGRLTLDANVNGFYADKLAILRSEILPRVLGPDSASFSRDDWQKVKAALQPFSEWRGRKPAEPFEMLSDATLATAMEGPIAARAKELIARDKAAAGEIAQLAELEKLILLQRWLIEIVNNFTSFSALYDPAQESLLRDGSLIVDGKLLDFAVRIEDRAAHRKAAAESGLFLVYATISNGEGNPASYDVVAPVTSGDRGRLRVGKRGIYRDRGGLERDAIVVDLLENAISISEAVRAPFRRASAFVSKRIEDMTGAQLESKTTATTADLGKALDSGAATVAAAGTAPPAPPAKSKEGGIGMRDLLLGGGIAFAALGSALAYVVSALSKVNPLNALLATFTVMVVIAMLSAFLGWLKLRSRDMAPVLEANGWALNARMKVTRVLGGVFTRVPALPAGAVVDRLDVLKLRDRQAARETEPVMTARKA